MYELSIVTKRDKLFSQLPRAILGQYHKMLYSVTICNCIR
jgi:hypothetical protein